MIILLGAMLIGLSLGIMGSGGSILTVPVLTYLLGHDSKIAIAESLAIVGGIALFGAWPYARSHQVDWRSVLFFGVPGMLGTNLGAWLSHFVAGEVQLILFGVVMLFAAVMMFRPPQRASGLEHATEPSDGAVTQRNALWKISLEGSIVGVITGLVGVGGGFLVVPALVLLGGLPMRLAVGTSLAVIALKSASGLWKYLDVLETVDAKIDWWTVSAFIAIGAAGSFAGRILSTRINQQTLRRSFAMFLLVMGVIVLGKEPAAVVASWNSPQADTRVESIDHL